MNKAFEKILERLEADEKHTFDGCINKRYAKQIVQEVAEEYKDGWIPCSDHLPKENGYYFVTQIEKSISNGKKIAVNTDYVEFSEGRWARAKHLEVIAWLDIKPYQPKGE